MHRGTIINIIVGKGYGFIHERTGQPDIFFHANELNGLEFDERLKERRVQFDVVQTDKGPRACNVQAAEVATLKHKVTK
jgi:CspA family cold shock protein